MCCPYNPRCGAILCSLDDPPVSILLMKTNSFIHRGYQLLIVSTISGGWLWPPFCTMLKYWLAWFLYRSCMHRQRQLLWVLTCSGLVMYKRQCFGLVVLYLWFLKSFYPLFHDGFWTSGRGWYRYPICGWALHWYLILCTLTICEFCYQLYCTANHFWCGLRNTLIYRYRDINLEASLILSPIRRRIIVVDSPLRPMNSQPWVLG